MERLIITPENAIALNKAFENLLRCAFSLQKITMELAPEAPATFNDELNDYCRELQRNTRIPILYTARGLDALPMKGSRPGMAYRILQHLLFAAMKSPELEHVQLELEYSQNLLGLRLYTKPALYSAAALEEQGGRYWKEMQNLLHRLNGSISWQTGAASGPVLRVNIPGIS